MILLLFLYLFYSMKAILYKIKKQIQILGMTFLYYVGSISIFQKQCIEDIQYNAIESETLYFLYFLGLYCLAYFSLFFFSHYFDLNKKFHVDIVENRIERERVIDIIKAKNNIRP